MSNQLDAVYQIDPADRVAELATRLRAKGLVPIPARIVKDERGEEKLVPAIPSSMGWKAIGDALEEGRELTSDLQELIDRWWKRNPLWEQWNGLGIFIPPGLVHVEADTDPANQALLDWIDPDTTWSWRSQRGFHVIVRASWTYPNRTYRAKPQGLEVRGPGTLAWIPVWFPEEDPPRGASRRWIQHPLDPEAPLAERPDLPEPDPEATVSGQLLTLGGPSTLPEVIPQGQRNETIFRLLCRLRGSGLSDQDIPLVAELLNQRCDPPLSPRELEGIVRQVAKYPQGGDLDVSGLGIRDSLIGESLIPNPTGSPLRTGLGIRDFLIERPQSPIECYCFRSVDEPTFPPVSFLVPPFLPEREQVVLAGPGDVGKSTLLLHWGAQIAREKGLGMILVCSEDPPWLTLERWKAAGGPPDKLIAICNHGFSVADPRSFQFLAQKLQDAFNDFGGRAGLIVVEDTGSFFPSDRVSSNSEGAVRLYFACWRRWARLATVVHIRHLRKTSPFSPELLGEMVLGSGAWRTAPRVVLLMKPKGDEVQLGIEKANFLPRDEKNRHWVVELVQEGAVARVKLHPRAGRIGSTSDSLKAKYKAVVYKVLKNDQRGWVPSAELRAAVQQKVTEQGLDWAPETYKRVLKEARKGSGKWIESRGGTRGCEYALVEFEVNSDDLWWARD